MQRAFITGLSGLELTDAERSFVAETKPAGLILFARNCADGPQIASLIDAFKSAAGPARVLVLVDQEGGRVQRLRPPIARALPPAAAYAAMHPGDLEAAANAARLVARLAAEDLRRFGFNMDCAPVLDIPVDGAHDVIGNRAFGRDTTTVATLGRAIAEGLLAGGIVPVLKHIPGHGRALADSHHELPVVDAGRAELLASDLVPFKALADLPAAMTAHVVYSALDATAPASTSLAVTRDIIRGHCGFDGLLMSDDLGMHALRGSFEARTHAVIAAGSDLALHCSGKLDEMHAVAAAAPPLEGPAMRRVQRAFDLAELTPRSFDAAAAERSLAALMAHVA